MAAPLRDGGGGAKTPSTRKGKVLCVCVCFQNTRKIHLVRAVISLLFPKSLSEDAAQPTSGAGRGGPPRVLKTLLTAERV